MTLILGVDPGLCITGFSVVRETARGYEYMASRYIRTGNDPLRERLHVVFRSIREVIRTHDPTALSIEQVFMARNTDSVLKLEQAWRAIIVVVMEERLSATEYTASQVKQAAVGTDGADKQQMQMMAIHLLRPIQKPRIDALDALAIALCHIHTQQSLIPHGLVGTRRHGGRLCLQIGKALRDRAFAWHPGGEIATASDPRCEWRQL